MNLFFKSLIFPTFFFTKSIEFIAFDWTTGKNKVNCTFEGQQLLLQRIYKSHYDYQNFSSLANGVYFIAVTK